MRRLADAKELLDGPLDQTQLVGNLRDLARVNGWLGGADLSWSLFEALRRRSLPQVASVSLLDIGTGQADIPRYMLRRARASDIPLEITATDVRPEIVDIARRAAGDQALQVKLGSADRIDEADGAFDIVHASMVLHHLEPAAAVDLLREMRRVARKAVIVNDLDRGRPWLLGAQLLSRVATRNGYTRHDAPLSVRRAYRPDELSALAARAGLREVARLWTRPRYRYALLLERA